VSPRIPVESGPFLRILEAWYLREGRASPKKPGKKVSRLENPYMMTFNFDQISLGKGIDIFLQPWLVARGDWVHFIYTGTEARYAVVEPKVRGNFLSRSFLPVDASWFEWAFTLWLSNWEF
jgi:hypothetical protein